MSFRNGWTQKFILNKVFSVAWEPIAEPVPPTTSGGGGGGGGDGGFFASPCFGCSPILLDLGGHGFHLGDAGGGVNFDIDADGSEELIQWVAPSGDEVFLALDRNGNGIVDDGSELFGDATPMLETPEGRASNGFQALAQYDLQTLGGDGDGEISAKDEVWSELILWQDANADGISAIGEVMPISGSRIRSLGTIPKVNGRRDPAGNWLGLWSWASADGHPKKVRMIDVFFRQL